MAPGAGQAVRKQSAWGMAKGFARKLDEDLWSATRGLT